TSGSVGVPYDVPRAIAAETAACTSGCAWPSSIGPHEEMRSTYSLPSTSVSQAPCAERMKRGVPPTALNARTGEFTPPGVTARARSNRASDADVRRSLVVTGSLSPTGGEPPHRPAPAASRTYREGTSVSGVTQVTHWIEARNSRVPTLVGGVPAGEGKHPVGRSRQVG